MPQPRKNIISLADTPYYHCMSRCVRRAFLCGVDHYSGNDYEHRRAWLQDKLHHTANAFAIKLCAYTIMNNHYHVVLNVRSDLALAWSDKEVVERWHKLFSGTPTSQRFAFDVELSEAELDLLDKDIALWRNRLMDVSWFMRIVNESIARRANSEDKCTGRFWEGRFKSQALLDEKALLSCMAYVDLNPVRAKVAATPELSDYTCVQQRIFTRKTKSNLPSMIEKFVGSKPEEIGIPFELEEYLELVDWTGRILRTDKRGAIDAELPPILERLSVAPNAWETLTSSFEDHFSHWVGAEHIVKKTYNDKYHLRVPSTSSHKLLFS